MKSTKKQIPEFESEEEEREFWATHDFTDFVEATEEIRERIVDVRPPKAHISFRLNTDAIAELKALAGRKGMGYQTLMRAWILERLEEEKKKAG